MALDLSSDVSLWLAEGPGENTLGFGPLPRSLLSHRLGQWFLTCGEFPTGGEWRSCQVGNDRSDSRTTASKFNSSHPNVDLLYKVQPFTDCFNGGKWRVGPLKNGELEKKVKNPWPRAIFTQVTFPTTFKA